ncbi:hypothetical protein AEAC466_09355 [Asticcacaulis sp. AC466]|uniref:hypothetical protein n=1 Tax=Asticcacaulis sp. AC466 TaxID=1282362 RepID=UPI0003C3DF12|nr:hypothetical protein [Asticcacaulis sp. AC466]ESQ84548.1 hypothetical protein AEAC466_09355 [Asticcacaulis sp. AC466]
MPPRPIPPNPFVPVAIVTSYLLLAALLFAPIAQPCGDLPTVYIRLGLIATLWGLFVYTALAGRRKAFWLAPQLFVLASLLLTLPQELAPLNTDICLIAI